MKIAVAGTGYVGLVTGVCLASKGHEVTCVDVDEKKLAVLNAGRTPIYEPGLQELMEENRERLTFTSDYRQALPGRGSDFHRRRDAGEEGRFREPDLCL